MRDNKDSTVIELIADLRLFFSCIAPFAAVELQAEGVFASPTLAVFVRLNSTSIPARLGTPENDRKKEYLKHDGFICVGSTEMMLIIMNLHCINPIQIIDIARIKFL